MASDTATDGVEQQEKTLTCIECHLTFEKVGIEDGEITRCPRCESVVVA